MLDAMLPGSFDPPTNGHLNLIKRAAHIADRLFVIVAVNRAKNYLFSGQERLEMMQELLKGYENITVVTWDRLIVDFARENDVHVMIRGVRALADFEYEFELAMTNKQIYKDLEVIFLPTDPQYFVLRASAIKELASYGAEVRPMVPDIVADKLRYKLDMLTLEDN
ncbi:MAG: pantetheine-phosphate adenylyltransferase [Spirochaetia bacterium]|nr:pantetheine-phosphate adenylyltransferase [Spirochaetia bacterium]MCF7940176.1 pantetheine-phosphate adenylyltransferase [Spirochaetia bacterium]